MQKAIYSVSEAVHFLGIQSHVLRYWEEELCLPIGRNEMGHRYYTRWDNQVFLSIRELKKKGYALKEIGELITLFIKIRQRKNNLNIERRPFPYQGNLWKLSVNL